MISAKLISIFLLLSLTNVVIPTQSEVDAFSASHNPDDLSLRTKLALLAYFSKAATMKTPKCCKIDPPPTPVYDLTGHLIGYQPTSCPAEYLVCCNGFINLLGTCLSLTQVSTLLPQWQQTANNQGITLAAAIQQSGILIG